MPDIGSMNGITPRDQDRDAADTLLGINCRGSLMCTSCRGSSLAKIKEYINSIDDDEEWGNGDQIVCNMCPQDSYVAPNTGLCAFPQKMKKDEKISGKWIKSAVQALSDHKCGRCGSCPIHEGNNVNTGEITVN